MIARLKRNKYSILGIIVTILVFTIFEIVPKNIANFTDVMSNLLSFSSMTTAIFMAVLVFVPKLAEGPLKDFRTDAKFLDRILLTTLMYFVTSLLALLNLIFYSNGTALSFASLMLGLNFGSLVGAVLESFYIFIIIFNRTKKDIENN